MADNDMEKLGILLNHWVEHNREHGEEFRKWAEKAHSLGKVAVYSNIMEAANQMDNVNEPLLKALEELKA